MIYDWVSGGFINNTDTQSLNIIIVYQKLTGLNYGQQHHQDTYI